MGLGERGGDTPERDSLETNRQGLASAAALILFGIILVVTMINMQVSKKRVHY